MLLELILIYAVFVVAIIVIHYYYNLLMEKDEYTRDDLKHVMIYTQNVLETILKKYSLPIILGSSLIAIMLTLITDTIIMNSSIIFIVLFFILPIIAKYMSKSQVIDSETYFDTIANILIKYNPQIILGFGFGNGCALIYSWAASRAIHFLWFLLHIILIVFLLNLNLKKTISQQ